jgi:hypothetical protein
VCNPRNYDQWLHTIAKKQKEKQELREQLRVQLERQNIEADEDILCIFHEIGDGPGKYLYRNGDEYEGDFVSGQRHGRGVMVYAADGAVYEGEWKKNKQDGHGRKDWGDGIVYEGAWKDDCMHGQGRYTMSCGSVIEGLFERDEFAE